MLPAWGRILWMMWGSHIMLILLESISLVVSFLISTLLVIFVLILVIDTSAMT